MMISGRNNNNNKSGAAFPFTASQWQELEQQLLTFKYIMSGIPVPPQLFSTVLRNPFTSSSSSSGIFLPNQQQQSLPFGWGCFQMGYGRKIDPEPGRCRRTDGKKWRCSKEACSDSKYCEKHMHRGKNKTKKQIQQVFTTNTTPKSTTNNDPTFSPKINTSMKNCIPNSQTISPSNDDIIGTTTTTYPYVMGHNKTQTHSYQPTTFYPFMSPQSSSSDNSINFIHSTQNFTSPHWLLDSESYDQPKKEMRYL